MRLKHIKFKQPYNLIIKILIYISILLLSFMLGVTMSNLKYVSQNNTQIETYKINEYTCANGKLHDFKYLTSTTKKMENNTNVDVWAYMCKKCGYDKIIVVE